MYFIRTEETPPPRAGKNRSVSRWSTAGWDMESHLRRHFEWCSEEQYEMVSWLCDAWGLAVPQNEPELRASLDELAFILRGDEEAEAEAARLLGFEPFETGWAKFLAGLCALEEFENEPTPEEVTATLHHGELFRYLVCYEGERVGWDYADGGWSLFQPARLAWIHDRGADAPSASRCMD